jgi:hypothetical protein
MKRCLQNLAPALPAAFLGLVMALALAPAAAQSPDSEGKLGVRQFPPAALRGLLVVQAPPEISLNGKADRLAPGARIRSTNNTYVVSGALLGQELLVNYTRDSAGLVYEVWVLTAEEAREKRAGLSMRNFSFGFESGAAPHDDGKTPYDQLPGFKQ